MGRIRTSLSRISQAFLPVNPFAGKLRALLMVLLFFIGWTLNAQNRSLPIDGLIRLQPERGFIANVLRDLAGRYFHPGTLWLTFTPVILFFLARKQAAILLSEIGNTGADTAQKFLDRCAFSFGRISITASDLYRHGSDEKNRSVQYFGGPAQIVLSAQDFLIWQSFGGYQYQLVYCNSQKTSCQTILPHQQSFTGIIPAANLIIRLPLPYIDESLIIRWRDDSSANTEHNTPIIIKNISQEDAQFLLQTEKPEMVILPLISRIIQQYHHTQADKLSSEQAKSTPHTSLQDRRKPGKHSNYAKSAISFLPRKKWFSRPRKHTLYGDAIDGSNNTLRKPEPPNDQLLDGLEAFIQQEMVSFFNLDRIEVTRKNRG